MGRLDVAAAVDSLLVELAAEPSRQIGLVGSTREEAEAQLLGVALELLRGQIANLNIETAHIESMGCSAAEAMQLLAQLQRKMQMVLEVERRLGASAGEQHEQ